MAFNDFGYWTETKALKRSVELRKHAEWFPALKDEEQITKHFELLRLHKEFYKLYGWSPLQPHNVNGESQEEIDDYLADKRKGERDHGSTI